LDVTLQQALDLLAQPKMRRGGGQGRAKEPVKVFDASPVTSQPVRLMQGRYGPYVSDGVTNASLPRAVTIEEMTFEYALNLLKDRAAAGPSKRATRKRAAPKAAKKPAKKATKKTAKKAAGKKTVRKKKAGSEDSPSQSWAAGTLSKPVDTRSASTIQ
jgi:DNA topoisomerase-1